MGILENIMADDAVNVFCDPIGGFAEPVVYTALIAGVPQPSVTINVVVDRDPPTPIPESPRGGRTRRVGMVIARRAIGGLETRPNHGDLVVLSWRVGDAPTTFRVSLVPDQNDPGIWQIYAEVSIR